MVPFVYESTSIYISTYCLEFKYTLRSNAKSDCQKWFFEIKKYYIDENNLKDILKDPSKIFNSDETALYFNP